MSKRIGEYILDSKIGNGSFGNVYCAKKLGDDNIYAVKVISKKNITDKATLCLNREIEVLQAVDNPHIIKLYDIKHSQNNYYLIFEYCNGGDLAKFKERYFDGVPEQTVRRIISEVSEGLCSLYEIGGIHRDIKLKNILLNYSKDNPEPIAKLCDFGFSKIDKNSDDQAIYTSFIGTPINMSPEMIKREPYNVESDIWSLGTITYELLCGKYPFDAKDGKEFALFHF